MSIEKIYDLYKEYNDILSLLKQKPQTYEMIENSKNIEFRRKEDINISFLKEIKIHANDFDIYCNPFPDDFTDVLEDLERGTRSESEIKSVAIIYSKEPLLDDISNMDFIFFDKVAAINATRKIHPREGKFKLNIGIPNNENLETELFNFIDLKEDTPIGEITKKEIDTNILKMIEFYLSNNRNSDQNFYFNPFSFVIKGNLNLDFARLLQTRFYNLMLESLSDKKEGNTYIISGEKSITIMIEESFSTTNYTKFLDIFLFLISQQKYTEKFIITKKVFTLYIHDKDTISYLDNKLPDIWKTINHYYDHYVEDNIKEFFKTKDQLLKEAMNVSKVIYEQTDKINNSIIASIISIIVLLATTVYRSLDNITVPYALSVLIVFFIFSTIYYYLMHDSSHQRYDLTKKQFEYFIKEISLIQKDELKSLQDTYLEKPFLDLKNTLLKLVLILGCINLMLLISFIVILYEKYKYLFF
ncbi:hypothetical protein RCG17_06705 [Neobacillus sp. PS3-12]|uniref:hypothetical protein n=1 Tax=Neobacillus sp. PS3-12 TaxID=3070677 RepID=UPI0027E0080E|nr:hypothetical protein [Neobacillus sp. PS3-12]WML54331.1 hypothetical protein RCG17_06705 [Neobacillus sp. PS3-12]